MADFISINPTTWKSIPKDDPRDRVETIVGDDKQVEFYPQVKIQRWDNEVNFSVRLISDDRITQPILDKEKIAWNSPACGMEFSDVVPNEEYPEGAFKFEYILKSKPATNQLRFSIETKGLTFYKQLPFTKEYPLEYWADRFHQSVTVTETQVKDLDGKELAYRPENTVNSYAIYHSGKPINYVDGKLYRCGKFGHIYRPKIIDALGKWVWGDLDIDPIAKIYVVTIPQKFLDTAVYPIRSNDTFGYTTVGAGNSAIADCWGHYINTYTATAGDEVTQFSIYGYGYVANQSYDLAIYDVAGGVPVNQLDTPVTVVFATGFNWNNSGAISQVLAATTYSLCVGNVVNQGDSNPQIKLDSLSNSTSRDLGDTLADPWVHFDLQSEILSMYATYTPVGGAAWIPRIIIF